MKLSIVAAIAAKRVKSLIWEGDSLVDWVAGGARFHLDGSTDQGSVNYAYRFDAACGSPSGRFAVIYERLGTKGLVLDRGKILREIDRSFYCAHAYEFPVCVARLASGDEVLIHCPEAYNRLDIDKIATGVRLTKCSGREPHDFFHSRLAVDDTSALLLSAGWVWHPFDYLSAYRLEDAVRDPKALDEFGLFPLQATEICSATFVNDRYAVMSTSTNEDDEEPAAPDDLRPDCLAIWDIAEARILSQVELAKPVGTLMAVGRHYVVGFCGHPKLFDLGTGRGPFGKRGYGSAVQQHHPPYREAPAAGPRPGQPSICSCRG